MLEVEGERMKTLLLLACTVQRRPKRRCFVGCSLKTEPCAAHVGVIPDMSPEMPKAEMAHAIRKQDPLKRMGQFPTPPVAKKHVRRKYDLDPDTLECPICSEAFSPPVYQCENGHTACSTCCQKITMGCPSCSQPIGRIRNIAIEKVIESLQVECKHGCYGCKTMVKYTERTQHEKNLCEYRPIECPVTRLFPDCTYEGPKASIPLHLAHEHRMRIVEGLKSASFKMKSSDTDVLFQAKDAWLMVCWLENFQGDAFHCDSVGASAEVAYKLTVKPIEYKARKVYSMESVALGGRGDESTWDEDFLLVPGGFSEHEITVSLI